ncbi:APC family permease [Microbaculum marinum]|uniref:APC family permease n=1 Tax=Microbaculum marinum TaxID=1764581 RepID=A0AAW9RUF5_9HYPH
MTPLPDTTRPQLRRTLGFWLLTLYGLGVVVGAGIYVLIGAIAGIAGIFAPFSFVIAAAIVGVTSLSYMELASRLPEAAGEAAYVDQGFGSPALTVAVGLALVVVGTLAAATIALGAAGYLHSLMAAPVWLLALAIVAGLGAIALWGILESAVLAAALTVLEVGGLLLVAGAALFDEPAILMRVGDIVPPPSWQAWSAIVSGSVIAFFAFIGFEDMVNVAEEVKAPERTMPRAIALVFVTAVLLYLVVATVCVLAVPVEDLAASSAPLALVAGKRLPGADTVVTLIAIAATLNGILVQFIMAPRVLYGLARRGRLPAWLGRVGERRGTPANATLVVLAGVFALTLSLHIGDLAAISSQLIMAIFVMVNLALVRLKRAGGPPPPISVPLIAPVLGAILSAALLVASVVL